MRGKVLIVWLFLALLVGLGSPVPSAPAHAETPDASMPSLADGWSIYAGRIVEPRIAATLEGAEPVTMPHIWKNMSDQGPNGAFGMATYVRHVKLPGPGHYFALVPGKVRMVYHYYAVVAGPGGTHELVDLGGNGAPGPDAEADTWGPPRLMRLNFEADEFDLVVQVSNNSHFLVGMIRVPDVVPAEAARAKVDMQVGTTMAYVGLLVAVGLYTMLLAFWHAGESYYYVGCVMMLTMALRILAIDGLLWLYFPHLPVTIVLRVEYITFFAMVPGLYWLAVGLYPSEASIKALLAFVVAAVAATAVALWAPLSALFSLRDPYTLLAGVAWLMALATFIRARASRRDGATVALIGLVAIAVAMALDVMLYNRGRPTGTENVPMASMLFAIILMWLFTARYRKEQAERDAMARGLEQANTALQHRAEELDKAQDQAASALQMKASFLANISHEVRTPLNAIIGFSDLLLVQSHAPADVEKQREYLRLIRNNGQQLLTLMTDILSVSDLEAGRFDISPTAADPRDVVDMCVGFVAPAAMEKRLFLDVQCKNAAMQVDERLMRQAIIKILSNAVKYSPERGVVTVNGRVAGGEYMLTVVDTGPGIAEADLPKAMELFGRPGHAYTASKGGMGLGLPLVSRFMELMGGRMNIDTIQGVGTTVTLTFPLQPPAPKAET